MRLISLRRAATSHSSSTYAKPFITITRFFINLLHCPHTILHKDAVVDSRLLTSFTYCFISLEYMTLSILLMVGMVVCSLLTSLVLLLFVLVEEVWIFVFQASSVQWIMVSMILFPFCGAQRHRASIVSMYLGISLCDIALDILGIHAQPYLLCHP